MPICFAERTPTGAPVKEEHIVSNMLVCRIKRGIDINRSSRLFLQMFEPKLRDLAAYAVKGSSIDPAIALADLQSQTILRLQHYYVMGEKAYPLHYLFGTPNGHIVRYAGAYAKSAREYEDTYALRDPRGKIRRVDEEENLPEDEWAAPVTEPEETETDLTRTARDILEDGVTFTLQEYRILKFCLANAGDAKRPLHGLHIYLERVLGIKRAKITRSWQDVSQKLAQEVYAGG